SHKDEPTELITEGPFRYTRNPLYLALIVTYLGLTALLNSPWPLIPLVLLVGYFDRKAKQEEEYLAAKFGDEFVEYTEKVRRWL
ncbi:MAG: isoprenylcysteine carboxylmethyltransferase family protein, partial [Halobacteriaceae archaeon]